MRQRVGEANELPMDYTSIKLPLKDVLLPEGLGQAEGQVNAYGIITAEIEKLVWGNTLARVIGSVGFGIIMLARLANGGAHLNLDREASYYPHFKIAGGCFGGSQYLSAVEVDRLRQLRATQLESGHFDLPTKQCEVTGRDFKTALFNSVRANYFPQVVKHVTREFDKFMEAVDKRIKLRST